jgi:hypothetical protein
LDILGADVQNAYLQAETKEKVCFMTGPEFGSNQGRPCIIVCALYLWSSLARSPGKVNKGARLCWV